MDRQLGSCPGAQQLKGTWDKEASWLQEDSRDTWAVCSSGEEAVLSDVFFVGPRGEPFLRCRHLGWRLSPAPSWGCGHFSWTRRGTVQSMQVTASIQNVITRVFVRTYLEMFLSKPN